MSLKTLDDLFIHELRDLYNAETQLLKSLPKMAKAATADKLRQAFEDHLQQTRNHVDRLEQIFEQLSLSGGGVTCEAMKGLVKEGQEIIDEDAEPHVKDAALIAAAQRVEHYEIAGYGTARTYARLLANADAERLLQQTLDEEKDTDHLLTELAESEINVGAMNAG